MTKKDYELIAAAIKRATESVVVASIRQDYVEPVMEDLANDLAGELTKTNPRFDQRRFLVACGVLQEGGDV
jgi:predicted dinucleotide-binding enzyme